MVPLKLIWRNLFRHKLRVFLTAGSLTVAFFLLCVLQALVVSLDQGVKNASKKRLVVQSAVSLFVNLPASYQGKIEAIEGVEETMKMTWFGAYFREPSNMFAQFAVDADRIERIYPNIELVSGTWDQFRASRMSCLVGRDTAAKYGWSVGDRVPLVGMIYPRTDGTEWQFDIAGIYDAAAEASIDDQTLYFHWEYLDEALDAGASGGPDGIGVYSVLISEGFGQPEVGADIDSLFENGPQRVQSTPEGEFNAQFVSMVGNVPFFVGTIGMGVLIAILLATLNTMLMSGREQTRDVGVLKALGFGGGAAFWLLLSQAILLCGVGAGAGILFALGVEGPLRRTLGSSFPGFEINQEVTLPAISVAIAVALIAGLAPALRARRLTVIEALREEF